MLSSGSDGDVPAAAGSTAGAGGVDVGVPAPVSVTPHDLAVGYPVGDTDWPEGTPAGPGGDPRRALEEVVRASLLRPPCIVGFSGGRDSSAVLAVATHVARREGLPLPIPVSRIFLDAPQSEESSWQQLVVRHLGLDNWVREEIDDEMDLLGRLAQQRLRQHGVLWSPLMHGDDFLLRHADGGSIIDGEGGDEVLDPRPHRVTPLARFLRAPRSATAHQARVGLATLLPAQYRAWRAVGRAERGEEAQPWLRSAVRAQFQRDYEQWRASQPLDARHSILRVLRRRSNRILAHNRNVFAAERRTRIVSPLLNPAFVAGVAALAGRLGYRSREQALGYVVGDLLPDAILGRRDKATFGEAVGRAHTRAFVEGWSGRGIDPDLVDPEILRRVWQMPHINALSAMLLQSAWLADDQAASAMPRTD